jgi:hypothetical protein
MDTPTAANRSDLPNRRELPCCSLAVNDQNAPSMHLLACALPWKSGQRWLPLTLWATGASWCTMEMRDGRLAAGAVIWAERWIARVHRKPYLQAERLRHHEKAVRTGTEPPGFPENAPGWARLPLDWVATPGGRQGYLQPYK